MARCECGQHTDVCARYGCHEFDGAEIAGPSIFDEVRDLRARLADVIAECDHADRNGWHRNAGRKVLAAARGEGDRPRGCAICGHGPHRQDECDVWGCDCVMNFNPGAAAARGEGER